MTRRPFKLIGVLILILLPFGVHSVYQHYVAFPKKTAIATGPAGGRYRQVGDRLAETIQSELGVNVRKIETNGSLDNFRLLTEGRVQFCIYQHGTQQVFQRIDRRVVGQYQKLFRYAVDYLLESLGAAGFAGPPGEEGVSGE